MHYNYEDNTMVLLGNGGIKSVCFQSKIGSLKVRTPYHLAWNWKLGKMLQEVELKKGEIRNVANQHIFK